MIIMRIKLTVREICDAYKWMEYCELTGTNDWALAEGLMSDDDEIELTMEQAIELGFWRNQ